MTVAMTTTAMPNNFTTPFSSSAAADEDSSSFQISYIYLSTIGLFITLAVSNLLSLVCPPPSPQSRRQSLYSRLIWNVPFYAQFWSELDGDADDTVRLTKSDEAECLDMSRMSSS